MRGSVRISEADLGAVLKNSDEWSFIEYMLQINARTTRVKLLHAWHVAPSHVVNQFEKRTDVRDAFMEVACSVSLT